MQRWRLWGSGARSHAETSVDGVPVLHTVCTRKVSALALTVSLATLFAPSAQADEPWLLDVEGEVGTPLSKPQSRWYGVGGTLAVGVQRPVLPWLALTGRLRTAAFLEGEAPTQAGVKNPGTGTLNAAALGVVLRLPTGDVRRSTGLWFDAVGGAGFTGDDFRGLFELGLGYGFALTPTISLSPVVRYLQIIQSDDSLNGHDAEIGLLGARVSLFDTKPKKPAAPPPPAVQPDRDGDGLFDAVDQCPDVPEDRDEYEDTDGCPEVDNDNDGIVDVNDGCPNIAEDRDGFRDEDGCLEDDNDRDGFLDGEDQCPNDPETLNGEQDDDGCPDSGLIVMRDDRIVLEERVLFETDRARLTKGSEPVLRAIVRLSKQHPEWTKFRVEGHADARGDEKFNQELSERRAINVREQLVALGMDKDMVVAEGYGATVLQDKGDTEEAHQANRRVEFVVIEQGERKALPPVKTEETPATAPPAAPSRPTTQPTTGEQKP